MKTGNRWAAHNSARLRKASLVGLVAVILQPLIVLAQLENPDWRSSLHADHKLVGRIFDTRAQRFLSPAELGASLQQAELLMLGEKHDNPDHHVLQLAVLRELQRQQRLGLVALEMLSEEQAPLLASLSWDQGQGLDALSEALDWDGSGWDWGFYGPILGFVLDRQIPLATGNISQARMREVYGSEDGEQELQLDPAVRERLLQDIDDSHCGMLPESQFPAMLRVQQARDRAMAEALSGESVDGVRVLIAGNYHARRDLGVLNYLPRRLAGAALSLSFVEVNPQSEAPADYVENFSGEPAHDYLWFTPAISNKDYCADMGASADQ
jgi:uncharacterized iron-regulated protein